VQVQCQLQRLLAGRNHLAPSGSQEIQHTQEFKHAPFRTQESSQRIGQGAFVGFYNHLVVEVSKQTLDSPIHESLEMRLNRKLVPKIVHMR